MGKETREKTKSITNLSFKLIQDHHDGDDDVYLCPESAYKTIECSVNQRVTTACLPPAAAHNATKERGRGRDKRSRESKGAKIEMQPSKNRRSLRKNPVEAMGRNALEETAAPASHLMTNEHKYTGGRIEGREPISYIPPGPRIMPSKRHRAGCSSGGLQPGSSCRACCRTRCRQGLCRCSVHGKCTILDSASGCSSLKIWNESPRLTQNQRYFLVVGDLDFLPLERDPCECDPWERDDELCVMIPKWIYPLRQRKMLENGWGCKDCLCLARKSIE